MPSSDQLKLTLCYYEALLTQIISDDDPDIILDAVPKVSVKMYFEVVLDVVLYVVLDVVHDVILDAVLDIVLDDPVVVLYVAN